MKKSIILHEALFLSIVTYVQAPPTGNYVQTKMYLEYSGSSATKFSETVQYFDGLGSFKQIVNVKASSLDRILGQKQVEDARDNKPVLFGYNANADASAAANNDETSLLSVLNTFRNSLPNYQITTYTYDSLVGVRSITPPTGSREVYFYDSANRLKEIRENSQTGNLLKEFKYNYKQ
ncbi:hypothetical protein [Chryseobacterium sp. MA9]|uniref:hypothetical protein n=1 Tax=Chryseobacterium sp. MA9 TaxID=2966625 RepID=UPI0021056A21|nr:hypothetical protein [Chryseobacterium sp. MA9]UTX50003.1 hypothetical protein KIK00_07045 [Chryseobacterium sp. MA9]